MKAVLKQTAFAVMIMLLVVMVACSGNNGSDSNADTNSKTTADSSHTSNTGTSTSNTDNADNSSTVAAPLGKYKPPIEITTGRSIPEGTVFADGENIDDNVWTKEEQENLGIKVKNVWTVPGALYDQKLNVTIASGDIPDFMRVNGAQLNNLVESDLIEDLTDILPKYSSDILTKTIAEDPYAIKSATFDGKLMAIPLPGSPAMGASNLWVREDWLEKLNLQDPQTLDDVLAIAKAFVENDPDGNGAQDTFGLGLTKDLWGGLASLEGFFSAFHQYPTIWVTDESGKAAFGGIQPEIKTVLLKLQQMYKSGMIDTEFGVKDSGKVAESIASNQIGLFYGSWWNPYYPLQDALNKNPTMRWKHIALVSTDSQQALSPGNFTTSGYYVVRKGAEHPEAIVKMANYLLTKYYVNNEVVSLQGKYSGIAVWNYPSLWIEPPTKNVAIQQRIKKALESQDESTLTPDEINNLTLQRQYTDGGDVKQWAQFGAFGPDGSLDLVQQIIDNDLVKQTLFNSAPTPTMVEKMSALNKLQLETYTKIIMGVSSADDFDKFVSDWKKFGGDKITQEVNDWYAKNQ
ncbi:extracellular solute-binding protein [Paenibacillus spongiae]|uniref:Extracellular solute-binding protein n=1 Tax=Paenibacillus spongiae TaxID=2909671 RepID=A0ABY5S697_9BACL|nr:extracellular solute-binding protein [Paenibacillus spongiae]UVI29431.1 extracellular solute-binding protein [Paenibacillus spongiae]